jgi:LysM repeat protein
MSLSRLAGTAAGMAATGLVLAVLAPHPVAAFGAVAAAQHLADTAGADAVVLQGVGLLAWLAWAWGALGLLLTAAGTLPGALGLLARGLLRLVLPAGGRRAAALVLGAGIGLTSPVLAGTALAAGSTPSPVSATSDSTPVPVPDWPAVPATATPVPGLPGPAPAGTHVVARGDCLWRIAEAALPVAGSPTDAEVARSVRAWWSANAGVIGPDPDLLQPGQVLHPPASSAPTTGARP